MHSSDPSPSELADRTAEVVITGTGDLEVLNWNDDEPAVTEVALADGPVHARMRWNGTAAALDHPDCEIGGDVVSPERLALDIWPES